MTDKLRGAAQQAPMAYYALVIKADSGYESTTEGRCTADQYGAAMAALHGTAALAQQDAQAVPNYDKTELNRFAQRLYDRRIQEGRHGHYESMFHVIHKCIDRVCNPKQDLMWSTVAMQERHDDRVENIVTTLERVKQEKLAAINAAPTPPAQQPLGWLDRKAVECLQGAELNWMPAWNRPTSADPVPIFLSPTARATLTASEILNMTPESIPAEHDGALLEYARAVIEAYERKNGLKP